MEKSMFSQKCQNLAVKENHEKVIVAPNLSGKVTESGRLLENYEIYSTSSRIPS
jgi:hypothetical protein